MKKNGCNYRGLLASTVFLSAGVLLTVAPVNVKAANNNSSTMATTVIASNNASSNTGSATTDQSADNTVNSTNVVSYDSSDSIDDGNDNQSNISNNADIVTMNSSEQDNNVDNDSEAQGNISPSDPTESQVTSTADASTDTNTAQAEVSQETVSPEYSQTETLENNVDNQSNSAISADDSNKSDNQAEEKSDMTQAKLQSVSKSDNQVQVESANKENSAKQLMAYSSPVATNNKYQFKTASVAAAVQSTQWTWLPVPIYIPGRLVDATIGAITSIPGLSGLGGPLNAIRYVLTPPWAIALNSASGLLNNMIVSGLTNLFPNNSSIQTIIGELENPLLGDSLPIRIFLPIPLVTPPTTPETPVTPPTTPETPVTPPTTPETPSNTTND
ncbi:hypothetical protein, partial [Lentilactobacillus kosonis]|uniref:hypothetical protein n=1 Tax=Lentilactobacillus kosonis TaxID=2810561 RepID=UPI0011CFDDB8